MKRRAIFLLTIVIVSGTLFSRAALLVRDVAGAKPEGGKSPRAIAWALYEPFFSMCQDNFYNAEYAEAEKCFSDYIGLNPNDSRGYWRKAYAMRFRLKSDAEKKEQVRAENEKRPRKKIEFLVLEPDVKDEFVKTINRGLAETAHGVEAGEDIDLELYIRACLLSMRGWVEVKNSGTFGLWTAQSTLQEVISTAARSKYQDAAYLIGLTNYQGADHGIAFRLCGLPHNRELGLAELFGATLKNHGPYVDDIWFAIFGLANGEGTKPAALNNSLAKKIASDLATRYRRNKVLQEYLAKQEQQER